MGTSPFLTEPTDKQKFEFQILTRLFPLAILMVVVYIPYSFIYTKDYFAAFSLLGTLIALILLRINFKQIEHLNITKDILIFLGFPVLIPWLISGGPENAGLWWAPTYALWVSFFAKGKRYFIWLTLFTCCCAALSFLSYLNLLNIAYSISELLNILFAFIISSLLIYFHEIWQNHYKQQLSNELVNRMQNEKKYIALLNSAPDAIIVANEFGEIILANTQAEIMFGYSKNELLNNSVEILLPNRSKAHHPNFIKQYFANPTLVQNRSGSRFMGKKKDGNEFPIELSLDLDTNERRVTTIIRDISKHHLLLSQLSKQNNLLSDFAAIASHDLRGPVGNLKTMFQLLEKEGNETEKQAYYKLASKVVINLEETLNGLLEIVTSRESEFEKELISFEVVLTRIIDSFASEIAITNAKIAYNFEDAPTILYSSAHINSIMQNLLSNALKYRSPNKPLMIHIETKLCGNKTILTITDNGLGIDLSKHGNKIFKLNQTFHNHPSSKGFGLYLLKSHLDSNGGSIEVESEINKTTTFTVTLPNS